MKTQLPATGQVSRSSLISLRQAAKLLGVNRNWLSAYLEGRGVVPVQIGPSLCVERSELEAIKLKILSKERKKS